jgi:GNAT superfamily N-acetyltransferase
VIALRVVSSGAELETWAELKSAVVPNEPVTAEQLVQSASDDRLLVLAELDGQVAGCGIGALSDFGGRAFIAARVLPQFRRRGVGSALVHALADHGRALGREGVSAFVYADDPGSMAFAKRFGLAERDYQLEQVRTIGDEPPPAVPAGIKLEALDGRREELLHAVWPVALEGYADLPLPGAVTFRQDVWLRDEATRPDGSFVAFETGNPVGYAGLMKHANGPATAEHGLTVVRRDRRGHGIARALKQSQLHWASRNGVVELVTWTQKGNEAMQTLNRSLGYADREKVITYHGLLP